MKFLKIVFAVLLINLLTSSCNGTDQNKDVPDPDNMIIRISEIEIAPNYLDEYISILKEEAAASVKLERGHYNFSHVSKRKSERDQDFGNLCGQRSLRVAFADTSFQALQNNNFRNGRIFEPD